MDDCIVISSDSSDDDGEGTDNGGDIIDCKKPIGVTRSSGVNSPVSMFQQRSSSSSSSATTRNHEPLELLERRRRIIDSSLEQYALMHNRLVGMEQFMNPSQRQTWHEFASTGNDERISGVDAPNESTINFNNIDQPLPPSTFSNYNPNLFRNATSGYPGQSSHSPLPSSPTAYPSSSDYNSFPSTSRYGTNRASSTAVARRAPKRTYRRKKVSRKRRSPKKSTYTRTTKAASSSRGSSSGESKPSRARLNMAMKMLKVKREGR